LKKYYLNPPQESDAQNMDSLIAEMVLDHAINDFQKKKIIKEIDISLEAGNIEDFMRLTKELKKYLE
jgi:uncharacterized protein YpiB (UPF0302 family)